MKKAISLLLIVFMTLTLAGCGASAATNSAKAGGDSVKVQNVNIGTATTSGAYYPIGNALAKIWNDKVPGVKASAQATDGSAQNITLLQRKESEIGFTMANVAFSAWEGQDTFSGRAYKDMRVLTQLYPNMTQIVVRKDSGINSVKDLKGKKFVPGANGSGTLYNSKEILSTYGLNFWDKGNNNVNPNYVGFTEAAELLKNKQVDAANFSGAVPLAAVMDIANSIDVKILSLEPDMIKNIIKQYPFYYEVTIPAKTYKGQDADVHTVALANLLVTRADLSEELVYKLTRGIFDNLPDLIAAHATAKQIKKEAGALGRGPIPLHPGAEKYFKEIGAIK